MHGTSGAGLTQLRFWLATGEPRFAERLEVAAGAVAAATVRRDGRVRWPVPENFDSRLRGLSHYGFAHGIAGVGYFLLAAGRVLGRDDLLSLADEAGRELVSAAIESAGATLWPSDTEDVRDAVEHWCSGSAGVGTFLVRLWRETSEPRYRELAEGAARAAWRRRWYASTVHCHGLAGIGEYLLDLDEAVGGPYRTWAAEIAELISARSALRNGRLLPPDETGTGFGAEFGVGMAGVLGFLLRLRYGGPRHWMADPVRSEPATSPMRRPAYAEGVL
jgi:lantibiotic modifying enzyme